VESSSGAAAARTRYRRALLAILLLGVLLRIYPLHLPYQHPEQEVVPRAAVLSIVRGDWQPAFLFHGSAFVYALRVVYTSAYAAGKAFGVFADRLDLLAAFVRDPFPFYVGGRLVVFTCSVLTLVLVAALAREIGGDAAGLAGALLLAASFIHVRESHHVWYDVPAATAAVAAVWFAVRAVRRDDTRASVLAAAFGGVAIATKHSVFPIALPVALAVWMAAPRTLRAVTTRSALAVVAALVTFAILSPYSLLHFQQFVDSARFTTAAIVNISGTDALPFATLWRVCIGWGTTALAAVGVLVVVARTPRPGLVLVAFPLASIALLASGGRLHARYLAPVAPFVALIGGIGAAALGGVAGPRRSHLVTLALAGVVALAPAAQSLAYVRVLARRDTRQLAADWIEAHVPPGTPVTTPSMNLYPNPLLEWDATLVHIQYPQWDAALRARGVADPHRTYPQGYMSGVFGGFPPDWQPSSPVVVTSSHPVVVKVARIPPVYLDRLRAAGARPVAEFVGFREPLTDVVYDPIDADYVPLSGFERIERPGPNITIWALSPTIAVPQAP
jgi:4-amino-4-deoxy-L-arabinose transferase-like glycosyltransferase